MPLIADGPHGAYSAWLVSVEADRTVRPMVYYGRLRSLSAAREWIYQVAKAESSRRQPSHPRHGTDTTAGPQQRFRAEITQADAEVPSYELDGTAMEIAFTMAMLGRTGLDEANTTGAGSLDERTVLDLIGDYRACVEELTSVRDDAPGSDRAHQLTDQRAMIRREIHSLAAASAPLSQPGHLLLAEAMLDIDTEALPHPPDGVVAMYQQVGDLHGADALLEPVYQQFENLAQARAWLMSRASRSATAQRHLGHPIDVRAVVSDPAHTDLALDITGTPAEVGAKLHRLEDGDEGIFLTGVTQIDHLMLARQAEAIDLATDYMLHIINAYIGPSTDLSHDEQIVRLLGIRERVRASLIARTALAAPEEATHARERLRAADQRLSGDHDLIDPATTVPSSGFVRADIQIGLNQLTSLTHHASDYPELSAAQASHRMREVTDRIEALLTAPSISAADADLIRGEITRIALERTPRDIGLYPWPSLTAIETRTSELTAISVRYGQRGFDDALRLHHLTQAVDIHPRAAEFDPHRRIIADTLLSRQHDHLTEAIAADDTLSLDTARLLHQFLILDELFPLPNQRAVAAPFAHPADAPPFVVLAAAELLLHFPAHDGTGEWYVGLENDRWVARLHMPHPAGLPLHRELGAAFFASAPELIEALHTGITGTDHTGALTRYPPIQVPETARTVLKQLQSARDHTPPSATPKGHDLTVPRPDFPTRQRRPGPRRPPPPRPRRI